MSDPRQKNKDSWNRMSAAYQESHGQALENRPLAWGLWGIPESQLQILGETAGGDILEFGCGGAQWATDLFDGGARVVGVDLSREQLRDAQARCRRRGAAVPLVLGDAGDLPLADASFDIVFCDHGAMSFAKPEPAVAEASRVLRPGGLFAFSMATPFHDICWGEESDQVVTNLQRDYFGLDFVEDEDQVCFQRTYGDWIRIFRANGLQVEDLVELQPPADATTTYTDFVPLAWARRFPAEHIWKLSKE
ncbi:MAG: class I SAM-dependent methyltransferase [Myxococcota bacterium]